MLQLPILLSFLLGSLQVLDVYDGDSLRFRYSGGPYVRGRLLGIDCPERASKNWKRKPGGQKGADEARVALEEMVKQPIRLEVIGIDRYKRRLIEIYALDTGELLNLKMIERGLCEAYQGKIDGSNEKRYREAHQKAKAAGLGIWKDENYESPRLFRKRQMR